VVSLDVLLFYVFFEHAHPDVLPDRASAKAQDDHAPR